MEIKLLIGYYFIIYKINVFKGECDGKANKNNAQISNFRWITGRRDINIKLKEYGPLNPEMTYLLVLHYSAGYSNNCFSNRFFDQWPSQRLRQYHRGNGYKFVFAMILKFIPVCFRLAAVRTHVNGQRHDHRLLWYRFIFDCKFNDFKENVLLFDILKFNTHV